MTSEPASIRSTAHSGALDERLNECCRLACRHLLLTWNNTRTNNNSKDDPLCPAPSSHAVPPSPSTLECTLFTILVSIALSSLVTSGQLVYLAASRHSQDAIYPVLRTMRITSLPLLAHLPNAESLYEDACLLQNPYYELPDVSCWPCEQVRTLMDLTGFSNFTSGYYQSGIPFVVKDALPQPVTREDIHGLLAVQQIPWTRASGSQYWKVNRAQYARLLRTLFRRPYFIPRETEVSVQHFLFLDQSETPFPLPLTEFANVFLIQGSGPRLISLAPVRHCAPVCKPLRVLLDSQDVLFYNWLFWRPVVSPLNASFPNASTSVTYMGSFY